MAGRVKSTVASLNGPHEVDLHVGGAVRMRRKFLGMSQEALAEAIGLTFQQVQKYERGSNRISSSKLYEISKVLKMPIGKFFEGLDGTAGEEGFSESRSEKDVHAFLMTTEGIEIAQAFPYVRKPAVRRKILDLVRSLAQEEGDD